MATTQNLYTGNGSTTNYSFTFEYLAQADVKATLNGTATTAFTLPNATTLAFSTAPANGVAIRIFRDTNIDALNATFFPGSAIKAEDLNSNFTQNQFATQETDNEVITANTTADSAVTTANTANTNASAAVTTADGALNTANGALDTANAASTNATNAVDTANTADTNASAAVATANAASAAVSNVVIFTLIANVAAIPASPSNNDYIEIGDSTGIQSFSPLSGLPSGFVGASGLTVRLSYDSSSSSWLFMNYLANDSETRYLKIAGPTFTGNLEGPTFNDITLSSASELASGSFVVGTGNTYTNTVVGSDTLSNNTTGSHNTGVGKAALTDNTTGDDNTACGSAALRVITGSNNTAIGKDAGYYIDGSNNTILGAYKGTSGESSLSSTVIISAGTTERLRCNSTGTWEFPGAATFAGGDIALNQGYLDIHRQGQNGNGSILRLYGDVGGFTKVNTGRITDGGTLLLGNDLTGPDNSALNFTNSRIALKGTDGSATFAGNVSIGDGAPTGGTGFRQDASGLFRAGRDLGAAGESLVTFNTFTGTSGIVFAGSDDLSSTSATNDYTSTIFANGAAIFKGGAVVGSKSSSTSYVESYAEGLVISRRDNANKALNVWVGGYTNNSYESTSTIKGNGAATFAGNVTATVVPPSDARFKENITPANPQLADVVALGGLLKNYDWNADAPLNEDLRKQRQLGLIAQEAEVVCPGLVKTLTRTKQGKELTPAVVDSNGVVTTDATYEELDDSYKGLSTDVIIMKLLGAVAELKAEVDALRAASLR